MALDVDSLLASSRGAVSLPVIIIPTESSLSFKFRLCLPLFIHLGVHCTASVTKSAPSASPRIVEVTICTIVVVTASKHTQIPKISINIFTEISATAIEGMMLGSMLGYKEGIIDDTLNGKFVGNLLRLNDCSRLGVDDGIDGADEGSRLGSNDGTTDGLGDGTLLGK